MKKRLLGLQRANDVPLLEQEKIKYFACFKKKHITVLGKTVITVLSTLFVIGGLLSVFMINDLGVDNLGDDTSDKQGTAFESDIVEETTDTDLGVIAPETDGVVTEKPASDITLDELYKFDHSKVLEGEVGIIPMDLSQTQNGVLYINNLTGFVPNLEALLEKKFKNNDYDLLANKDAPRVLVIHTHATDSYVYEGQSSYKFDDQVDFGRSDDTSKNVISLGNIISKILCDNGINSIHCTTLHDSIRYKDSYARSEATIREYLEKYPTIQFVIDIHSDSLLTSGGDIVRPVTIAKNKPTAQIMCVVGSDWSGDNCEYWQDNLSLALKLREQINLKYSNVCRPVELSPYTFNQEFSRYSMTIKIGSSGNSLEEAQRAAELVGDELVEIIKIVPF